MSGAELAATFLLPIGLGLFGFVEPCSIGSTLVFIKLIEGKPAAVKVGQVVTFALTRAIFIGLLGAAAAVIGAVFLGFQKAGWIALGLVYLAIGILYLTGHIAWLMRSIGPRLAGLGELRASAALGTLFGLNIPACAAPLLLALLAASASGATAGGVAGGFVSLALFGLALSLPLVVAVLFARARRALDWLASLAGRTPRWTGVLLIVLGVWSVWFGLFVTLE
ncbi:MAG: cytochrome c biogenesis protein CcdA [Burkholderiales bacterium]